jgi:thiol-disulfide isomerase/thioredoxin
VTRTTRQRTEARNAGPNVGLIIGVLGVVVVIAVLAVALSGGDDQPTEGEYGTVEVAGDALAPLTGSGADPAAGQDAPSLSSVAADGTTITIDPSQEAGPVVLFFLAHWCPHCQAELPLLVDLQDQGIFGEVRAVAVLTGTTSSRPNFPPSAWLDDEGWAGERFFDDEDSSAANAFGLTSFPFAVFIDRDGAVAGRVAGEIPPEQIAGILEGLTS